MANTLAPPATVSASKFLTDALANLGSGYTWGGDTAGHVDCSGLVAEALGSSANIGRTSEQQFAGTQRIGQGQLQPGDLIFEQWPGDPQASPGHVVIYLGKGMVLESPSTGGVVQVRSWNANETKVVGYGRVPNMAQNVAADPALTQRLATITQHVASTGQAYTQPMTGGSGLGGEVGTVNVPKQPSIAPMKGVNIKNFYGYDLTPFNNSTELGKMEQTIKQYVIDPGYAKTIDTKLATTYGYQTNWWKKIPEVNTVMLYAAVNLDPSNATQQNEFQSMLAQTSWWKTTTSNGRYWDEAYGTNGAPGTDPAQANQALTNAQEKVLADANQIGVTLSKQELNAIALTYAKNNYVASGSFGTASGTAAEWLDQAIIDTLLNIQGQNAGKIPKNFSTLAPGQNQFTLDTTGAPGTTTGAGEPTSLFGISGQLYNGFQQIAQQYMMYNPNNPAGSLLTQKDLMDHVQSALQNYTGSGSSFGSSNLINGAEATFTELMKTQAKQMYPTLAGSIDAGTTPQAYFAPYASTISNMLYGTSANAATINLMDPKWNWAIATPDPKTGIKNPLTLDQVQQKLVTMPQWQQSNNAQQMGTDVVTSLNKQFGFGGT